MRIKWLFCCQTRPQPSPQRRKKWRRRHQRDLNAAAASLNGMAQCVGGSWGDGSWARPGNLPRPHTTTGLHPPCPGHTAGMYPRVAVLQRVSSEPSVLSASAAVTPAGGGPVPWPVARMGFAEAAGARHALWPVRARKPAAQLGDTPLSGALVPAPGRPFTPAPSPRP